MSVVFLTSILQIGLERDYFIRNIVNCCRDVAYAVERLGPFNATHEAG
jgi:hypothetical protein